MLGLKNTYGIDIQRVHHMPLASPPPPTRSPNVEPRVAVPPAAVDSTEKDDLTFLIGVLELQAQKYGPGFVVRIEPNWPSPAFLKISFIGPARSKRSAMPAT